MKNTIDQFADARISGIENVIGGGGCHYYYDPCCYCPPCDPTPPKEHKVKGNNGVGNGFDPPPPGLAKQPDQDFNDGPAGTGPGSPGARGGRFR